MLVYFHFFSTDTPTTDIYTLSLHDALPISICIDVDDATGASFVLRCVVHDAANPGTSANRNVFVLLDDGEESVGRLRLCADHAAEGFAVAAISAAGARNAIGICVGAASSRCGNRIRMIPERLRGFGEY